MDIKAPVRTGGHILIDQLALHGADTVFGVPGESFLAALDGMYQNQRVRFINARQEGGATMMADAYGKLTGRPGIAFATRGPGATNASSGVHVAFQDSTPMILLLGQVGRDMMEREAFQEIDYRQMFGPMTKWVAQIDDARRIPEFISRAFYTATSGRPGPVVLALPEDMLTDEADVPDAPPYKPQTVAPGEESLRQFEELLAAARKPLLIVGGGGWSDKARRDLEAFAAAHEVPISASFRCQDYFDNLHAAYAGHVGIGISPKFAERIRDSDLIIALGARLGEITTSGYSLFDIPKPKQPLVHIYPDPEEIGRVYAPTLGIVAGSAPQGNTAKGNAGPAAAPSTTLSTTSGRTSRPREAPSAARSDSSDSRWSARVAVRPARLAQASNSTAPTLPSRSMRTGREFPVRRSRRL